MENNAMPPSGEQNNPNHMPKAMLWLIIVAIIVIAVVVFLFFWMGKDETVAPSANPQAKSEDTEDATEPTTETDAFAGWNEYTIEKNQSNGNLIDKKFKLKVPSDWQVENNTETGFKAGYPMIGKNPNDINYCYIATLRATGYEGAMDAGKKVLSYGSFSVTLDMLSNGNGRLISYKNRINGISLFVGINEDNYSKCQDNLGKVLSTVEEVTSDTAATDNRTVLTPSNYSQFCTSGDDCKNKYDSINKDEPNTTVRYSNSDLGIAFDVPYNTSWINSQYKLNPYEQKTMGNNVYINFGKLGMNCEGICAPGRLEYSVKVTQSESAENVVQRYSNVNVYSPQIVTIGDLKAVKYADTGMVTSYYIEVVGAKHNYVFSVWGLPNESASFTKLENIVKSVDLLD